jgi:acetylcholinesterase
MESGAPTARCLYPYNHPIHEEQFQIFLKNLGLSSLPEDEILPRLRSLSFGTIRDASESVFAKYMESIRWPFQPCIDGPGGIIPTAPITSWRNHDWNKVPILTGFNTNEGAMFVPANMSTSSAFTSFFSTLRPSLTKVDLDTLNKVYQDPNTDENSPYTETRTGLGKQFKRLEAAYAHFAYIAPVRHTAHLASKPPTVSDGSKIPPVYLYHFGVEKSIIGGSNHGDHQFHVDQEKNLVDYSQSQREISEKMHAYWTSFIISGDPNAIEGVERPHWEEYKTEESPGRKIVFGLGNNEMAGGRDKGVIAEMRDDTWARRECDFWWSRIDGVEDTSSEHL